MTKRFVAQTMAIVALGVMTIGYLPAEARVVCSKGFRVVNGQPLATPYCQDLYLAQVAREYGSRVTAREILNNPNTRREVCQFVGQDIRVKDHCDLIVPRRGRF